VAALLQSTLMYFVLPAWLAAGLADWLCHRATRIEDNAGPRESVFHLVLLAEMGVAVLLALFFRINALVLAVMLAAYALHEFTTWLDLRYAQTAREIRPVEQIVHGFQEGLPLLGLTLIVLLHWEQFLALFGLGAATADFTLRLKQPPLPPAYSLGAVAAAIVFNVVPYVEELLRGLRAQRAVS
jgi:hypothetical protein